MVMIMKDFEKVYVTTMPEALIIKSRIEAEGIPVILSYDSAVKLYGITVDGLGEVKVLVPSSFASRVREIIKKAKES